MRVEMGKDSIRYFLYLNGRWRWRPTEVMKKHGFGLVSMGKGGPDLDEKGNPRASVEDKAKALRLNAAWDSKRLGLPSPPSDVQIKWPAGSIGHAFQRALSLRLAARLAKGVVWTKKQEGRDDWPRAWKWIGPKFGDCDPLTIQPEHFLKIDEAAGEVSGLMAEIEREVSITERHRTIKVWRAFWKIMQTMDEYGVGNKKDPSLAVANSQPEPRDASWLRKEVLKLVQIAWRNEFYGLAALMAVAWDSMLSPVDSRTLAAGQASGDAFGMMFFLDRAKTGKAAAGTLTPWSRAILVAYLAKLGVDLLDNTPLFWTRGGRPVSRSGKTGRWGGDHGGGRHVKPRPYSESALVSDFATVRALAFGEAERRQLADMRRSGAIEGDAGGGSVADQSNKMANTVSASNRLRKTYNPVNVASVRRFDEARSKGAKALEQKPDESVTLTALVTLRRSANAAKSLK